MNVWNTFRRIIGWESRANAVTIGHPRDPGLAALFGPMPGAAGVSVDEHSAMSYSAIFSGLKFICETVASLYWEIQELNDQKYYSADYSHPLDDVLNVQLNPEMSAMIGRETMLLHMYLYGCMYAEIVTDGAGNVRQLWPIHPSRVNPKRDSNGKLVFEIHPCLDESEPVRELPDDMVFRVPMMSRDGVTGRGLLHYADQNIGLSIAAETEAAAFYGNGSKPGGILAWPEGSKLTPERRQQERDAWQRAHGSSKNAYKVAVLEGDVKWTPTQLDPEKSQSLETRRFQVLEVSRWLNLPPQFLMFFENGVGDIEQLMLLLKTFTLRSLLVRQEQESKIKCFRRSEKRYRTQINMDSLLRGDMKSRFEAYSNGRQNGYLMINEIRKWENLPPVHPNQGETLLVPMNMQPQKEGDPVPDNSKTPTPNMKEAGATPVQSKGGPPDTKRSLPAGLVVAHRSIVADAMGRMVRKEAKAAQQASGKPREWLNWVEDFYAKHERQLSEALLPGLTAHCAASECEESPEEMAGRLAKSHCDDSKRQLIEVSDGDAGTFAERVLQMTEGWTKQRADAVADELLEQELAHV